MYRVKLFISFHKINNYYKILLKGFNYLNKPPVYAPLVYCVFSLPDANLGPFQVWLRPDNVSGETQIKGDLN